MKFTFNSNKNGESKRKFLELIFRQAWVSTNAGHKLGTYDI